MCDYFESSIFTTVSEFGGIETGFNSNVSTRYQHRIFNNDISELIPEEIRSTIMREIDLLFNFPCRQNDLVTSVTAVENQSPIVYRIYIVDPLDENGKFYYRGQGYLPNIVIVKSKDDKWVFV